MMLLLSYMLYKEGDKVMNKVTLTWFVKETSELVLHICLPLLQLLLLRPGKDIFKQSISVGEVMKSNGTTHYGL